VVFSLEVSALGVSGFFTGGQWVYEAKKGSLEVSGFFTGGQWFFRLWSVLGAKTVSLEVSGFFTGGQWFFSVIPEAPTDKKCTLR
jgi:hypothetical protein